MAALPIEKSSDGLPYLTVSAKNPSDLYCRAVDENEPIVDNMILNASLFLFYGGACYCIVDKNNKKRMLMLFPDVQAIPMKRNGNFKSIVFMTSKTAHLHGSSYNFDPTVIKCQCSCQSHQYQHFAGWEGFAAG